MHIKCLTKFRDVQEETVDSVVELTPAVAASAAAAAAAAVPECAPSTIAPAPSSSSSSSSSSAALTAQQQHFRDYGFVRVPSSARSRALAWSVMQLSHRSSGESIAGQVRQLALSKMKVETVHSVEEEWIALVKETALACGIESENMFVVDTKLLLAPPGKGHQPVHWDTLRHRTSAMRYSCILYCSSGCLSTALPRFVVDPMLNFSNDPTEMRSVAHLLSADNYESLPVAAGDLVIFRTSISHFGVRNTMPQGNRVVLFGILSPIPSTGQDAIQVFPWLYTGYAFGWQSREYAQSLVENREHKPLQRLRADETREAYEAAVACLRAWNLFEAYHS